MDAQQASRKLALRRCAATVGLTVAGCALVLTSLHQVRKPPAPVVATSALRNASARGVGTGTRIWFSGEVRGAALASSTLTLTEGAAVEASMLLTATLSAGDLAAAAETDTATPTLEPTAVTPTPIPPTPTPARPEIKTYAVQAGDNLIVIAQRFGINPDTLVWANPELQKDPDMLSIGQQLSILPVDGVLHTVKKGDTLAAIAQRYSVDPQRISEFNGITDPSAIQIDQKLIVPGGKPPVKVAANVATGGEQAAPASISHGRLMIPAGAGGPSGAPEQPGRFAWPVRGMLTQGYGKYHGAIDIATKQGTPIVAADAGTVSFAGPSGGLGNAVQIDHGDGFVTTYAHMLSISVQPGQQVQKGEQIGLLGSTGHSTGPHCHFIVTYKGIVVNPMQYLP